MSKRKKKASDIFTTSEPFLERKAPFIDAFPQIKNVKVIVDEFKDFWKKDDSSYPVSHIYDETDLVQFINCSENSCYGGGFSIGKILNEMVTKKQTSLKDTTACMGKASGRGCTHKFNYEISIVYK